MPSCRHWDYTVTDSPQQKPLGMTHQALRLWGLLACVLQPRFWAKMPATHQDHNAMTEVGNLCPHAVAKPLGASGY